MQWIELCTRVNLNLLYTEPIELNCQRCAWWSYFERLQNYILEPLMMTHSFSLIHYLKSDCSDNFNLNTEPSSMLCLSKQFRTVTGQKSESWSRWWLTLLVNSMRTSTFIRATRLVRVWDFLLDSMLWNASVVFEVAVKAHERAYIYGHRQNFYLDGYLLVTIRCIKHAVFTFYI